MLQPTSSIESIRESRLYYVRLYSNTLYTYIKCVRVCVCVNLFASQYYHLSSLLLSPSMALEEYV